MSIVELSAQDVATLVLGHEEYRPYGLLLRALRALLPPQALVVASSMRCV